MEYRLDIMIYKAGEWVRHDMYGVGQVTEESDRFAVVRFISQGFKKILVDRLERSDPPSPDFRFPQAQQPLSKMGRVAPKKPAHSFEHLLENFLRAYPLGF